MRSENSKPRGRKYESPRAVRLRDAASGVADINDCAPGSHAAPYSCQTGGTAGGCASGSSAGFACETGGTVGFLFRR